MNVLILNGSPRKNGNTRHLTEMVADELTNVGVHVKQYQVAELDIHPCIGCGNCEKKGVCIFQDDMLPLYEEIAVANSIIIASPIYFYGLTAQSKACIDRCQTLWSRKYILNKPLSDIHDRKGYLISVAATRGDRVFDGAILTARYGLDAMDATYHGDLLFPGVDAKGAIKEHAGYPDKVHQFIQMVLQG